jgi:hypothetical protein
VVAHWTYFYPDAAARRPSEVAQLVNALLVGAPRIRATATPKGGLKSRDLVEVTAGLLTGLVDPHACGEAFTAGQIDLLARHSRTGIAVQAGRAWMNNEALLAVLAAATDPHVDWLVLVVPDQYMGSVQASNITTQLEALGRAEGVDLELQGVAVVAF